MKESRPAGKGSRAGEDSGRRGGGKERMHEEGPLEGGRVGSEGRHGRGRGRERARGVEGIGRGTREGIDGGWMEGEGMKRGGMHAPPRDGRSGRGGEEQGAP